MLKRSPLLARLLGGCAIVVLAYAATACDDGGPAGEVPQTPLDRSYSERVADVYATGDGAHSVAFGHGSLWVSNRGAGTVVRIDPADGEVIATLTVGTRPGSIAVGASSVWVADDAASGGEATLSRIDPETNTVTATAQLPGACCMLAAGEGAIWSIDGDGMLARIDEATAEATASAVGTGGIDGVVAAGDIWGSRDGGGVWRFSPAESRVVAEVPLDGVPFAAADGMVWGGDELEIWGIATGTNARSVGFGVPQGVQEIVAMAAGDGELWVAVVRQTTDGGLVATGGAVLRFDIGRQTLIETIQVGATPRSMVSAEGSLWVTDTEDGALLRIPLDGG